MQALSLSCGSSGTLPVHMVPTPEQAAEKAISQLQSTDTGLTVNPVLRRAEVYTGNTWRTRQFYYKLAISGNSPPPQ